MIRKGLLIYCDATASGNLVGPVFDNYNYRSMLTSSLGGEWYDHEIKSLRNPTIYQTLRAVDIFLANADYTFVLFSGHGIIDRNNKQFIELQDGLLRITALRSSAARQTIIVDACRNYYQDSSLYPDFTADGYGHFIGDIGLSTRRMFDKAVMKADPGCSILFAAGFGQSALDTNYGGAYSLSLLTVGKRFESADIRYNIFPTDAAQYYATQVLHDNFYTEQMPCRNKETWRERHFPLFVKHV